MKVRRIRAGEYIVEIEGKEMFYIVKDKWGWIIGKIVGDDVKPIGYASIKRDAIDFVRRHYQ